MPAGRRSLDLHRLALDAAELLLCDPAVRAVAVTGSVARGDAGPGSDVDLWVLGDRNSRERMDCFEVPVTLLWQTPRQALREDTLVRYEVEDAWVLYDPEGLFRRVRIAFAQQREQLRSRALNGTACVIRDLIMAAKRQNPERAVALLREAARRAAATRVYADWGWRVPRWRHFERHLKKSVFSRLSVIQALELEPGAWQGLLRYLRRHDEVLESMRAPRDHYPPPVPDAEKLLWLSRQGRRETALLLLRQSLEPISLGRKQPAEAVALWRRAHGFAQRGPSPAEVRRLAGRCARLFQLLAIDEVLERGWDLRGLLSGRFY